MQYLSSVFYQSMYNTHALLVSNHISSQLGAKYAFSCQSVSFVVCLRWLLTFLRVPESVKPLLWSSLQSRYTRYIIAHDKKLTIIHRGFDGSLFIRLLTADWIPLSLFPPK